MAERQAFVDRVKGAERESHVVAAAVARFRSLVQDGAAELPTKTSPRDLVAAADQVEPTYLVRMWAEFEMALRSCYQARTGIDNIKAANLVDWTAGVKRGRAIADDVRDGVHEFREFRTSLVHGNPAPAVSIEEARRRLNTLLHCLPVRW